MFAFIGLGVLISAFFIIYMCATAEEAPDWIEVDEYYRNRWYK